MESLDERGRQDRERQRWKSERRRGGEEERRLFAAGGGRGVFGQEEAGSDAEGSWRARGAVGF